MERWIMITGAAGGLGKSLCVAFARRGYALYMTDVSRERLDTLADGLRRAYGACTRTAVCDMTDSRERDALYRELAGAGMWFCGLVNVAGVDFEGRFDSLCIENIRTMTQLNMCAGAELTRAILPHRGARERFIVINVASQAAFQPMPRKALYAAGKRFLVHLSLALREELRGDGVSVTALCPSGMPSTPECAAAIDAQGFMGAVTARDTGAVAEAALRGALRGRAIVIPGAVNRAIWALSALVPQTWAAGYVRRRWERAAARSALRGGEAQAVRAARADSRGKAGAI
jgi:short-subunit dehydrogenase